MPIRDTLGKARDKVEEHKPESGDSNLKNFETIVDYDEFLPTFTQVSIAQTRSDVATAFSGSPRVQSFNPATMTAQEKIDTGVSKINSDLFDLYIQSNSYIVHEGENGNTIFENGTIYWIPCASPNQDDFAKYKKLLERHMAYKYIDIASNSTSGEKTDALNDYQTYKNSL